MGIWRHLFIAAFLIIVTAARASTTLLSIPIADILGNREGLLMYTATGYERRVQKNYDHSIDLTVGLGDRIEVGAVSDTLGFDTLNFKAQLAKGTNGALSAGFLDVRGRDNSPFVVGRLDLDKLRIHAGWLRDAESRLMLGLDLDLGHDRTLMADHISGKDGMTWIGIDLSVPNLQGLGLTLAAGLPNSKTDGIQHFACVYYCFQI